MAIGKLNNLESAIYRLENALSTSLQNVTLRKIIKESLAELYQVRAEEKRNDS